MLRSGSDAFGGSGGAALLFGFAVATARAAEDAVAPSCDFFVALGFWVFDPDGELDLLPDSGG